MTVRLDVWPPLPPVARLRRPLSPRPFPLGEPGVVVLERARHGLYVGVRTPDLIHDLGFPQDARRWRQWCDGR